jgi:hypothetical protein
MDLSTIVDAGGAVLSAVGGASLLAAVLPRPEPTSKWAALFRLLDLIAANWLNARNAR